MNVTLYAEVDGKIDSKDLYRKLEPYGVNVTDLNVKTMIYGEVSLRVALMVIDEAARYGKVKATIS